MDLLNNFKQRNFYNHGMLVLERNLETFRSVTSFCNISILSLPHLCSNTDSNGSSLPSWAQFHYLSPSLPPCNFHSSCLVCPLEKSSFHSIWRSFTYLKMALVPTPKANCGFFIWHSWDSILNKPLTLGWANTVFHLFWRQSNRELTYKSSGKLRQNLLTMKHKPDREDLTWRI